jgi:hypothetical protein
MNFNLSPEDKTLIQRFLYEKGVYNVRVEATGKIYRINQDFIRVATEEDEDYPLVTPSYGLLRIIDFLDD